LEARTFLRGPPALSHAGAYFARPLRELLGLQIAAVPRPATTSPVAFEYYIRGVDLLEERNLPGAQAAIRSFEQALAEDPGFALAESALADSQLELMNYDDAPSAVLQARMREYAEKAVQLGPDVAEAHASLAAVLQTAWDYRGAEESYKTALRLNPRFSRAHRWYGGMLLQFGRFDDAFAEVGKAAELDPYDFAGQAFTGRYLYWARRYREALDLEEKALSQKDLVPAHETEGDVYCQLGYHSSGAASAEYFARALQQADYVEQVLRRSAAQAREPSASLWYSDRMHAEYYALSGRPEAARPYVERLATDVAAHGTSPVQLAVVYGMLGERDAAMDLLEKAAESKDRALMYVKVSPEFDPLRNLDRFQALLRKMKL